MNTATNPKFWDRIADKYAAQPVADEASYQKKLRQTQEYFSPETDVLEIGCGTGSTALVHAPHVRLVRAVDLSPRMIEICRDKADAQGIDNVTFEVGTLDDVDAEPGSFDAVLALSILHLLADKERFIARAYELLRPGGVFVTSTACLGGKARFWPLRVALPIGRMFGRLPLVRFFSPAQLRASLTSAGFELAEDWQPGPMKAVFIIAKKPA